jgi:hypothetical protein
MLVNASTTLAHSRMVTWFLPVNGWKECLAYTKVCRYMVSTQDDQGTQMTVSFRGLRKHSEILSERLIFDPYIFL